MRLAALAIFALVGFIASPSHAQLFGGTPAIEQFEKCRQKPFVKMVECGTKNRQASCGSLFNECSKLGNQVVAFANSLAKSVKSRQLSEDAAERQRIQFKMNYYNNQRRSAEASDAEDQLRLEKQQRYDDCQLTPGCIP